MFSEIILPRIAFLEIYNSVVQISSKEKCPKDSIIIALLGMLAILLRWVGDNKWISIL